MRPSRQNLVCLWLSVGLYAIAHVLPAITGDPSMFGWQASIACVEGATWSVLKGEPAWLFLFGWLPNPLFWLAVLWLLVRRRRNPRRAGIVTGLCGLAATALCLALVCPGLALVSQPGQGWPAFGRLLCLAGQHGPADLGWLPGGPSGPQHFGGLHLGIRDAFHLDNR